MKKIIYIGPAIFTGNIENPFYENGAVAVQNGMVVDIGTIEEVSQANPDAILENLGSGLLTPGLVNLHHHLYSSFARGWAVPGTPPGNFPEILERIWWKLDRALNLDDIHFSALVGLCESALCGVTAVADHHSSQGAVSGSLEMIGSAFDKVGLSGSICFELTGRDGQDNFDKGLRESLTACERLSKPGSRVTALIGLHASMTLSNKELEMISKATNDFNAGFHFHLAEDLSDQDDSLSKYGMRATERFASYGMLNEKSLAIHGVHLDKNEIAMMKFHKCNLVLCPRSNLNNAVGFPSWWEYYDVKLGLGTDGIGSDILNEAKTALYISRHCSQDSNFGFKETQKMMLENNPSIFSKITGISLGKIESGYPADMVFWRYSPPTPLSADNIWGHHLYGLANHRADSLWAGGRRIIKDGIFVEFDYDEVISRARILAKSLWERI
jgi:putative selenium metabolism protein SsnA